MILEYIVTNKSYKLPKDSVIVEGKRLQQICIKHNIPFDVAQTWHRSGRYVNRQTIGVIVKKKDKKKLEYEITQRLKRNLKKDIRNMKQKVKELQAALSLTTALDASNKKRIEALRDRINTLDSKIEVVRKSVLDLD